MNLAKCDLICKLLVCGIVIAIFDAIFENGLLSRLISGSNNCISVNICRFIAKMFVWDWFTGMLNYLGKSCIESD